LNIHFAWIDISYKINKCDNEYKSKGKKHWKNHLKDEKKAMEECP
jgi:hypothetical protein